MPYGVIYTYKNNKTNEYYIGSSFNFPNRHIQHLKDCNSYLKDPINYKGCSSYKVLMNNNYKVEILHYENFIDRRTMEKKENEFIDLSNPLCVNKQRSYVSDDEKAIKYWKYKFNKVLYELINKINDKVPKL